ncbi:MAG: hypothetical protein AB1489_32230 [Acidobacteriota bacterium]
MSTRGIAGTYEIEVLLGSQQVCLLEFDLPESKNELRAIKLETPTGEETFRGMLAGIFSEPGEEDDTRQIQVYDLLEGLSTIREALEADEAGEKIKAKLSHAAKDEVAKSCLQFFFHLAESLNQDKFIQAIGVFSKFILNKKESLPKVAAQSKAVPRWDRVVKQTVLITDEPTQDIEVSNLEEEIPEESDTTETEWRDSGVDTDLQNEGEVESEEGADSEIP